MGRKKQSAPPRVGGLEWGHIDTTGINDLLQIRADAQKMETAGAGFVDVADMMRRLSKAADKLSGYFLAAPVELLEAAQQYFNTHVEAIKTALIRGGADAGTIAAVLTDYAAILCGFKGDNANAAQIQTALNACGPETAYNIDKYAFFVGLLWRYQRKIDALTDFNKHVRQQTDGNKRREYLFFESGAIYLNEADALDYSDMRAAALLWLQDSGYITVSDFVGVDQETAGNFLQYIELYGENGNFLQYVYIARNALNATPEQLARLNPPRLFQRVKAHPTQSALNYAQLMGDEIDLYLQRVAEQVEAAKQAEAAPPPPEPQPQTMRETIETEHPPKTGGNVSFSENCAQILSRPMYATTDGKRAREILPITAFIADYAKTHVQAETVTPLILEKAVEGVNLLQQIKQTRPVGGIYTLETNLTEFSELCGYPDANEHEKQQLLTALHVLHNLYIVLWKPRGRFAVQLFGLQQYGMDENGKPRPLILNVFETGFRGRPQFWDAELYERLRRSEKGAAMRHFRHQIGSKGQAREETLLIEIFGYDFIRDEAARTNDTGQIAAVEEYIRKHKSRDRQKLRKWFNEWAGDGIITYDVHTNKNGEVVYKWKRLAPLPPEPGEPQPAALLPDPNEPDEQ